MTQTALLDPTVAETSISALVPESSLADDIIQRSLIAARTHLNLQVAYLSEFEGNETVFRNVDAPGLEHLIKPGDRKSLDDVYCRHILEGRLPELIPDTSKEALAASLPITQAVPIGAHVSVPVQIEGGELYGMFCCLGPAADSSLNERDLRVMRCFADMAAVEIDRQRKANSANDVQRQQIKIILAHQLLDIVYQPIWNTLENRPIGYEALSRFRTEEPKTPDVWFSQAQSVGLGVAMEVLAVSKAIENVGSLPDGSYLTFNCSPHTAVSPELFETIGELDLTRFVLELTEHEKIDDCAFLAEYLAPLRARGLRVAVDDAGAGYSGLQQILELKPDIIKLDRFFVRSIETDPSKQALAAALATFSESVACSIIAEGVETNDELEALNQLGFSNIQGYLLGKPVDIGSLQQSR